MIEGVSTRVGRISVRSSSGVVSLGGVESESDKKKGAARFSAFKIGFYFILETSVEFFFRGVEKLKVEAVLSISGAIVGWDGVAISLAVN